MTQRQHRLQQRLQRHVVGPPADLQAPGGEVDPRLGAAVRLGDRVLDLRQADGAVDGLHHQREAAAPLGQRLDHRPGGGGQRQRLGLEIARAGKRQAARRRENGVLQAG